jgi:hypothetical protein
VISQPERLAYTVKRIHRRRSPRSEYNLNPSPLAIQDNLSTELGCHRIGFRGVVGLSIVSGHHPTRRTVLRGQDGSGRRSRTADRSVPLPEREIDSEKLPGPHSAQRLHFLLCQRTTTFVVLSISSKEAINS